MDGRTQEVQRQEMFVTEELHDGGGHEIKGEPVKQGMRGVHVREAGREEGPSDKRARGRG